MALATKAELKTAVAARMGTTVTNMDLQGNHIDTLAEECVTSASDVIYGKLIGRGYAKTDVDAWPALKSWHIRLGVCHLFRALPNKDIKMSELCKCEDDLDTVNIIGSDGAAVAYTGTVPQSGQMTITEEDTALSRKIADDRYLQ